MSIWGSLIGGVVGFSFAGPIGALIGSMLGGRISSARRAGFQQSFARPQQVFAIALIILTAKLAKADGKVSKEELIAVKNKLKIPDHEIDQVGKIFNKAKEDSLGYEPYARQIAQIYRSNPAVLDEVINILFYIAEADGKVSNSEIAMIRNIAKIFGFNLMEPSPIELLSVLEAKSGPSIRDEIYQFKDKGDREVALRFDFTVGLTRYATSQKNLKLPAKFSSFGGVWRYDEPQKGRYRFFHQWNIETFGNLNTEHDAETIEFTSRFFDNLKLQNISIDINHRKLVESYINQVFESNETTLHDIFRAVDKTQKKSKDEILQEYKQKGYSPEKLEKILEFSNLKGTPDEIEQSFDASIEGGGWRELLDSWNELCNLYRSLKNRGVDNIRINFGVVRGLDYYTGIVFEAFDSTSDLGALVGGGRYDSLPNAFGRDDLGATGVAGGVERIILRLDDQGISSIPPADTISVLYVNDELKSDAINCVSKLRKLGISTNIDLTAKSLKKQMEMSANSKFCVIFAPKEFSEKQVVLRNMVDRTEKQISLDDLVTSPKDVLNL